MTASCDSDGSSAAILKLPLFARSPRPILPPSSSCDVTFDYVPRTTGNEAGLCGDVPLSRVWFVDVNS